MDLVTRHGPRHLHLARRIVGDTAQAEDVCQQAYLKAMGAEDQIQDPGKLAAWINRVITNQALDVLRKIKRRRRAYEARSGWLEESEQDAGVTQLERAEARDQVLVLLERLDEPIREVVVMRTMQGMTGNEVKQALGCSAALVSRRLHRGLEQLRQWIEAAHREEAPTR